VNDALSPEPTCTPVDKAVLVIAKAGRVTLRLTHCSAVAPDMSATRTVKVEFPG
jgi:hypothetical protein